MAATGVSSMAEAELVGRAFLDSPVATRVAEGSSTRNTISVVSLFTDATGRPCRVVEQSVMISGQTVRARGNVCQGPGGRWALAP